MFKNNINQSNINGNTLKTLIIAFNSIDSFSKYMKFTHNIFYK